MIIKLHILEPWHLGTEKPIVVKDIDKWRNNYLFHLESPYYINGEKIFFLIGRLNESNTSALLSNHSQSIVIAMAYDFNIDNTNYINYDYDSFRGNFLKGQLDIEK